MGSSALALPEDKIPAHIAANMATAGRGNEHVGANVQIPRLKLLQKMHDEVDKHHPKYVEGAEVGSFYNTVSNKIYGEAVKIISITFKSEFVVWKSRDAGGGKLGDFETAQAAQEAIQATGRIEDYVVTPTHQHLLIIKDPKTGELESTPVLMDFANTKLRVSKGWNAQIGMKGGDRFNGLWTMKSVAASNDKGSWLNIDIEFDGWALADDYKVAEALYQQHG
jgi:hypothetical protein